MDSKTIWNRLTALVKEFATFEAAISQSTNLTENEQFQKENIVIRLAIAQEIAGAFIRLAKRTPSELPYYRKAIAQQLGVTNFERWLEQILKIPLASEENLYLVAKDYSVACLYAGEFESTLRFWGHALTSSRARVPVSDAIAADDAGKYDATETHQTLAKEFVHFVRKNLTGGNDFIDLCCGTGLNAELMDWANSRITGIDLELGGLKAAGRSHYFHKLLEGPVEVLLPTLPEAHFDTICCCAGLYFFQDLNPLFEQASRLLRPGGTLIFNAWPGNSENERQVTRGGTYRYCHSKTHLEKCANSSGFTLKDLEWHVVYNMPNWFMAFQKI